MEQRLVENPLHGVIKQREKRLVHHVAIEPKMDSGDGRVVQMLQARKTSVGGGKCGIDDVEHRGLRHSHDERVGGFLRAIIEYDRVRVSLFDAQLAYRRASAHFPAALFDCGAAAVVKFGKRDCWNSETKAFAIREKCFPEHVNSVVRVGARQLFVKRADQHDAPKRSRAAGVCFMRCSQSSMDVPSTPGGCPPVVAICIIALPMATLSAQVSAENRKNENIM